MALRELKQFIDDGLNLPRKRVPCYINVYDDTRETLFAIIFCIVEVHLAPGYIVVHNATRTEVLEMSETYKETHMLETLGCYFNEEDKYRCVAVFRPDSNNTNQAIFIRDSYGLYQRRLLNHIARGFNVYRRKIYYDRNSGDLTVDVIFQREVSVSLRDGITVQDLNRLVEANQQNGLYLADGNARFEGGDIIYSAVFTRETFGDCEYQVYFNYDALLLFSLEQDLAPRCHIYVIIPTTGNLTPLFTAVFWCRE